MNDIRLRLESSQVMVRRRQIFPRGSFSTDRGYVDPVPDQISVMLKMPPDIFEEAFRIAFDQYSQKSIILVFTGATFDLSTTTVQLKQFLLVTRVDAITMGGAITATTTVVVTLAVVVTVTVIVVVTVAIAVSLAVAIAVTVAFTVTVAIALTATVSIL